MWAIFKKEMRTYFLSPVGYVAIGIFLIIYSVIFFMTTIYSSSIDFGNLYYASARFGLLLIVPILTMRMFAEEKKNGTDQLLFTSPISINKIVFGKFFAAIKVIGITLFISLGYYAIISYFADPDIVMVLLAILGFFILSMAAISFGMLVSSTTENQIVAGIITIGFFILSWFLPDVNEIFSGINILDLYLPYLYGVFPIAETVSLLSFTIMCILITILILNRRKTIG